MIIRKIQNTEPLLLREFILSRNSKLTQLAYFKDLKSFFDSIDEYDVQNIKVAHVVAFREILKKKYSGNYINRKLAAVKSYFHFLIQHGVIDRDPTMSVGYAGQLKYKPIRRASDEEVNKILDACTNLRHSCILHLLFYLGLRRAEICDLTVGSIRLENGIPALDVIGKGSRHRTLMIPLNVFQLLSKYLLERRPSESEPLFLGQVGGKLSASAIKFVLDKYTKIAGIDDISCHVGRVSAITSALENGASLESVKEFGGWSSLEMVLRYDRRRKNLTDSAAGKVKYK